MATTYVKPSSISGGVVNFDAGSFTSDGNDTVITLGFIPRWVKVINSTDAIVWEKIAGMAAANTLKTLPGTTGANDTVTQSINTSSAIVIGTDGTVTLSAALVDTSKAIAWVAQA